MQIQILPGLGFKIDSGNPWKTVWILALTHGNEPAGLYAQEYFLTHHAYDSITSGVVYFLQVNPRAYSENCRFIDTNMNRIFLPWKNFGYEGGRLQELLPYLEQMDFVLDLHSVPSPVSDTIGIAHSKDQALASKVLDVDKLLIDDHFETAGSLISYVIQHGGHAFWIECWQHEDPKAKERGYQAILRLLQASGVAPWLSLPQQSTPREVYRFFQGIYPKTQTFTDTKPSQNFEKINSWEAYAQDGAELYENTSWIPLYLGIIMKSVILWDGMGFLFEKMK